MDTNNAELMVIDNDVGDATDLCEDVEMKQRILELISEMKTKRSSRLRLDTTSSRRNSTARRSALNTQSFIASYWSIKLTISHTVSPISR